MTMTEKNSVFQVLMEILPARFGAGRIARLLSLTSGYIVKIGNGTM
jgi:hypothetical protein